MTVIKFDRALQITNLGALAHGTGAKYLECITGPNGSYIAKQWRMVKPDVFEVLIQFKRS